MNTERLLLLADKLQGRGVYADAGPVPAEKFQLREWFRWSVLGWNTDPAGCGYAACAVGWACTDPRFQALGLEIEQTDYIVAPKFGDALGHNAVMQFFELSPLLAEFLFVEEEYPWLQWKPDDVARRIRQVVAMAPAERSDDAIAKRRAHHTRAVETIEDVRKLAECSA